MIGKKYTYEYVQNYFKENGCELLEKVYISSRTNMEYKCTCGNISKIRFYHFKDGSRCKTCRNKKLRESKQHSLEYVKQYFKDNNCELLEDAYTNAQIKMKYRCSCGEISCINFNKFSSGRRCKKCGYKKVSESQKLDFDTVKKYFEDNGCELLEQEYKNSNIPMKYKCNCGNISKICFGNFQQSQRCSKCGGTEKFNYDYVYNYFKDNNCELLENTYINVQTKMKYKCECGRVCKISFASFKKGSRCRKCFTLSITGENNSRYNKSFSPEDRIIGRKYPEYAEWRKKVYKRDNCTCQNCGDNKVGKLNAHHIKNFASNKDLRTDVSNGITFCEKCHIIFHKIYGKKDNTKEQLSEYLFF